MSSDYKYDVAFSFLQDDEQLVLEIADRVRGRVNPYTFVYTERQSELVGTDGMETLSRLFAQEARVVVVMYREGWGETNWTRIEQDAIRNRAFDQGWDFSIFVILDKPATLPAWLPKTRLQFGFERYGIDGLASVIEERVQDKGGTVHTESVVDYASRLNKENDYKRQKGGWYSSQDGVTQAAEEARRLFGELERISSEITSKFPDVSISFEASYGDRVLYSRGISLGLAWSTGMYLNTLEGSYLIVKLFKGRVSFRPYTLSKPELIEDTRYDIDLDRTLRLGWREQRGEKRFYTSEQLADALIRHLLDAAKNRGARDD
jgi:hypothetical protein